MGKMFSICFSLYLLAGALFVEAAGAPIVPPASVVSNATYAAGTNALAPGTIAAIFGTNLNNGATGVPGSFGSNGKMLTTLDGASVTFNGTISAPLFSSQHGSFDQLNVQIPYELAGATSATVVVTVGGQSSPPQNVPLGPFSPGIFTLNTLGTGQGAVLISNTGTFAAPLGTPGITSRPAVPGTDFITIYCTGLGSVTNPPGTGTPASGNPLSMTVTTPLVLIGGVPAFPSFSGLAPGFVGLYQIDVQVPPGVAVGNAIPLTVNVGGKASNTVMIAIGSGGPPFLNLNGTAPALSGSMPGGIVAGFLFGDPGTGNIPISMTGASSGGQTVYTGGGTGSGPVTCPAGGTNNWTASISAFSITVNPNIASLTNGGIVGGNFTLSLSGNACSSSTQTQTLTGMVTGTVGTASAGGNVHLILIINTSGGGGGNNPVVFTGTATSVSATLPGTQLFDNTATGSVPITATGASSGNLTSGQTVYSGGGTGSGTVSCANITGSNTTGNWTASLIASATVNPPVTLLATNGGSVSGTWSVSLSTTACGQSQNFLVGGTVAGTVAAGGAVALSLTCTSGCGNGGGNGGGGGGVSLTGTATSLSATVAATQILKDSTATGSLSISATGTSSSSQTVYSISGSGSGTAKCTNGSTGSWTGSLTITATASPAVTSLVTNGGTVSGTWSGSIPITICGQSQNGPSSGIVTGIVSAGGAVSLQLD